MAQSIVRIEGYSHDVTVFDTYEEANSTVDTYIRDGDRDDRKAPHAWVEAAGKEAPGKFVAKYQVWLTREIRYL